MEWISVEERLPEYGRQVIASGFMFGKPELARWVEPAVYEEDGEFHPPMTNDQGDTVANIDCDMNHTTHWMPLPEPPK